MCAGSGVVAGKTVTNMSHKWDPPDPAHERNDFHVGRSNRSVGFVLLVVTALVAGGAASYVVAQWQDSRDGAAAAPTAASTTTLLPTTSTTTTIAATTSTTTTIAPTTTTTLVPTTTVPTITGDHMVFGDGHPLGHISAAGFAAYQGDAVSQLRQGPVQISSVVNFVGSQFSAQVRPLDPLEMSATCPVAVQPRATDNAEPLGLWVEAPTWQLQPLKATPVSLTDPAVVAVVQLITASNGVQPAPPPQRGSAVLVDLIGDGVPDLVVSATFSDDTVDVYYRLVAIAPDGNPEAATPVLLEFGVSFAADGSRDPLSRGEVRVDGVVEMTGTGPFELFIRRTTAGTKGGQIRDLTGAKLASWSCPR